MSIRDWLVPIQLKSEEEQRDLIERYLAKTRNPLRWPFPSKYPLVQEILKGKNFRHYAPYDEDFQGPQFDFSDNPQPDRSTPSYFPFPGVGLLPIYSEEPGTTSHLKGPPVRGYPPPYDQPETFQDGGVVPPWWETMREDPWYITGAKALLGEREVEEMRKGEVMPWVNLATAALFLGKGGRPGRAGLELPGPQGQPSAREILRGILAKAKNFPFERMEEDPDSVKQMQGTLEKLRDSLREKELPPETKDLLDKVRSYQPKPMPQPPRVIPGDVYNYEALPYAPRPGRPELPPGANPADYAEGFVDPETGKALPDTEGFTGKQAREAGEEFLGDIGEGWKPPHEAWGDILDSLDLSAPYRQSFTGPGRIFHDVGKWLAYPPDFPEIKATPTYEDLPYAPRPSDWMDTGLDIPPDMKVPPPYVAPEPPPEKIVIKPEDLPFGQEKIVIKPEDVSPPPPKKPPEISQAAWDQWLELKQKYGAGPIYYPGMEPEAPYDPVLAASFLKSPPKPWDVIKFNQWFQHGKALPTPEEVNTMFELGLKPPPPTPGEAQQHWEWMIKNLLEPGDIYQQPGGLDFLWGSPAKGTPLPPLDIPPRPFPPDLSAPPPPEPPPQLMQTGGVAGSDPFPGVTGSNLYSSPFTFPGVALDEEPISIYPDYRYIPSGDFGADPLPIAPDYPVEEIPPVEELPPTYDSRDFQGAANYYYVDPRAAGVAGPTYNYYGAADDYRRQQEAADRDQRERQQFASQLSSSFASMPPTSGLQSAEQQQKMLTQWAEMEAARRDFDELQRQNRQLREEYKQRTRFGMPDEYRIWRHLMETPVNRAYMRDFYPPGT